MNFEKQSTFKIGERKQLIQWLFYWAQKGYTKFFKTKEPWNISTKELLKYPNESFGKHLGLFLKQNSFELIPKVESHDSYHTITGYGTNVEDEIALQYLCFGNGKRSLFMFGAIVLGTLLLPEYYLYYLESFIKGKKASPFHHFNFKKLLNLSFEELRLQIFYQHTATSNIVTP